MTRFLLAIPGAGERRYDRRLPREEEAPHDPARHTEWRVSGRG
jgi:hypothetical protein